MQLRPVKNDEFSAGSGDVADAGATRAAQRAAKASDLTLVPEVRDDDRQPSQPTSEAPAAPRSDPEAAGSAAVTMPAHRRNYRRLALIGLTAALVLPAGSWYGYHWFTIGRFIVSTDDAYVGADATTLAAKVSGYVSAIEVPDNTFVHAGDVIARIDAGDYRLAVDTAHDKVLTQQATVARIAKQIPAQQAAVEQAAAQLASARAGATLSESEFKRQQALATRSFASQQTLEQAQSKRDQAAAAVQSAQAALDAAVATIAVLKAQQQEAVRQVQELKSGLAKADRDLSFTYIRAPIDGMVGNRAMQVGDYVQVGQRLASLVPLANVYIDANFKETQLAHLKPGLPASISVDALPAREITGTVESVSPASGSVFSLLPPDNATGNFTKIVQRLAVRIRLPAAVTDRRLLRPGMSVVVSVNTKPQSALANAGRRSFAADSAPRWQSAQW